ncbi:uncharacterized protein LOC101462845 isoform X1 [Ceratitis capitata]|uniref:uncharacterized protein LOC101462845 isoform X1 n=1 Tax=Ceratitis capitata TaxID=7213 RepID=UPI000A0FF41F|nr:uncharacterized protein LOC101462845 isoform X1 [Ceratitis capitata]
MAKWEATKENISITHFINPHLFWYHKVGVSNDEYRAIAKVEKELADYYSDHQAWTQGRRHPPKNTIVAVKFLAWNKLIRARVDHITGFGKTVAGGEFIMWALDYGFPFQTKADQIYRLPSKFATPINYIRCGGLSNILPAEEFFMNNEMITVVSNKWHQRACDVIEKALNGSECIVFAKEFTSNEQDWGELIIKTNMGVKYRVNDQLVSLHLAANAVSNFRIECHKLKTANISPWLCNNGNSKFQINRAYIYPGIRKIIHNGIETHEIECDDKAKQKVEEWYERNQFTAGQKTGFLDTTTEYTMTEGSVTNTKDDEQNADTEKASESDESQLMQLAGVLSKSRIKKYVWGRLSEPPPPDDGDFDMEVNKTKTNKTLDTVDSEISSIKYLHLKDSTINTYNSTANLGNQQGKKVGNTCSMPKTDSKCDAGISLNPTKITLKENNNSIGTLAEHLINIRKQYINNKTDELILTDTESVCTAKEPQARRKVSTTTITKRNASSKNKIADLCSTFHGLRMIPAGYDIMNLHDYNDQDHWHCKKSTLNDRAPHNEMDLFDFAN